MTAPSPVTVRASRDDIRGALHPRRSDSWQHTAPPRPAPEQHAEPAVAPAAAAALTVSQLPSRRRVLLGAELAVAVACALAGIWVGWHTHRWMGWPAGGVLGIGIGMTAAAAAQLPFSRAGSEYRASLIRLARDGAVMLAVGAFLLALGSLHIALGA